MRRIPAITLDDRLRLLPGFTPFRRSSPLTANAATQGVSRTLVLGDGAPLNRPAGGREYWTRVAPEDLGRVEAARDVSVSVFGDRALGGSIALFGRPAEAVPAWAGYPGGNRNPPELSGGGSWARGGWGLSGNARHSHGRALSRPAALPWRLGHAGARHHPAGMMQQRRELPPHVLGLERTGGEPAQGARQP